jgi:hypothetical protein
MRFRVKRARKATAPGSVSITAVRPAPAADPDSEIYEQVGEVIHQAATDEQFLRAFKARPTEKLIAAGVDPAFLKGKKVKVVRDTETVVHVVVPHQVKKKKKRGSEEYMRELGFVTIMGCK